MIFMKTEELNALTDEELVQVSGGFIPAFPIGGDNRKVAEPIAVIAGLPAGKIISEVDMQQVSGGCSTSKPNTSATPTSESGTE